MRTQCIVLLLVIYYAGINTIEAVTATDSKRVFSSDNTAFVSRRLLRSQESVDKIANTFEEDNEERVANVEWVSRLAELDRKTSCLRKYDMQLSENLWMTFGENPVFVFNQFLKRYNTWAKIDNTRRTVQWFRFTKRFRDKNGAGSFPDYEIYKLLGGRVPEEKLAFTFESLKQIPDVKNLAETMQKYQFKLWIDEKENPTSIAKKLGILHSTTMTTERGLKNEILSAFTKIFNGGKKLTRSATVG